VLSRWLAGVHDGKPLFEEIQARGFKGTARLVRRFLQTLREKRRPLTDLTPTRPSERFSVRKAVWLFIREQTTLTTQEQEDLTCIRQASPTAEASYGLVQDFLTMVRKREGERLDTWIEAAQQSAISELHSFVTGLLKDKDAVEAGLTLPVSQWASRGPGSTAQVGQALHVWQSFASKARGNEYSTLPDLHCGPFPRSSLSSVGSPQSRFLGDEPYWELATCWSTRIGLPSGSRMRKLAGPVPSAASCSKAIPAALSCS